MEKYITLPRDAEIDRTVLMQGENPAGASVAVNRSYFLKDGKPWLPVMGEIHYSRLEEKDWKRALAKMKAGGIDIVATYVFWIYHEEVEGRFDWTGRRNLRHFIELCEEAGLAVLLRIGPWDHGEVRNGGYPDWLLAKNCDAGFNNEEYFGYAKRLYDEIFAQVEGFLYKDGGPIIGVQIDNEYGHCHGQAGEEGIQHMRRLKELAVAAGFDVPFYTATGWGGAVVVEGEMIPVLAAYAEGSWEQHLKPMAPPAAYLFADERDDVAVGSDLSSDEVKKCTVELRDYPYATCEIGGGMQDSHRRRPVITADDTECLMLAKLGSGANMIGYYMYQGGTNDAGKLTDLQETEATGYPNDLPKRSYDYQAPLGEFGEVRTSYHYLRLYHMLCHDFGDLLTETATVIPDEGKLRADNPDALRVSVRHKDGRGFVFLSNYQRGLEMAPKNDVRLTLTYGEQDIVFPAFTLGSGERLILPFGLKLGSIELESATAQPLCHIVNGDDAYWFFFAYEGRKATYDFRSETVRGFDAESGEIVREDGRIVVTPGASAFAVLGIDGKRHHIVTLTRAEAERSQKLAIGGKEYLVSSDADLFVEDDCLVLHGEAGTDETVMSFPELPRHKKWKTVSSGRPEAQGIFQRYGAADACEASFHEIESRRSADGSRWYEIELPSHLLDGVADVGIEITCEGDVAELYAGTELLDDQFLNGLPWHLSLGHFRDKLARHNLLLKLTPLTRQSPVYRELAPDFDADGKAIGLATVRLIPEYERIMEL